ncbi:MAG TPA: M23 family metallopeptidase, partial [Herpetosiphonaceae bacterium]|nr:M23 family metallopeptidase [Herpetosiphonaceae bacterium]
ATHPDIAGLGLKLPFEPGMAWQITNGWDAHAGYEDINGDGQSGDWNRYALDFVPANGVSCEGQPILAVAPGRIHTHDQDAYGAERLVIQHANDLYSMYVHLQRGSVGLAVGDAVSYGTVIGACGHTGRASGAHLHFQLYRGPTWDRDDGVLPLPMDGIVRREQLRSRLGGLRSSNRPLAAAAACPPASGAQPTPECPGAQQ